jgi:hypothetical protein
VLRHSGRRIQRSRFFAGVYTPSSLYYPAAETSRSAGGRRYSVLVPYDTPVRLGVSSNYFTLADAWGKPLAGAPGAVLRIAKGAAQ